MDEEDRNDAAKSLVEAGGELVGATTGATFGLVVGGPAAAVLGAAGGALLKVGADFAARSLSPKQKARVGAALAFACDRAWHRIMDGDKIRDDGFFTERLDGVAPAEEVAEAVLLAVQDEPDSQKAPYLGYLLGNIAFEPTVDPRSAHDLVAEAKTLSFTQLCLLAAVGRREEFSLPDDRGKSVRGSLEAVTVRSQFDDLGYARRELIGQIRDEDERFSTSIGVPSRQALANRGVVLFRLMELGRIPDEIVSRVVIVLREAYPTE